MEQHFKQRLLPVRLAQAAGLAIALCTPLVAGNVQAQVGGSTPSAGDTAWQRCASLTDDREARLGCFDRWAAEQARVGSPVPSAAGTLTQTTPASRPEPTPAAPPVTITITTPPAHDCRSPEFSELSRFWELEAGTDCGSLNIRGYRPISLSWISADSVNTQPDSPSPGRTAAAKPYSPSEARIQLSVRTKIAQGLLTREQPLLRDSLWFGYTQQSHWQLFNGELSRPFRSTDHEPELTYVYPTDAQLPLGWRLRYSGVSLVHQSNGQDLPLSRSWNRLVLMAGMEKGDRFRLQGRLWKRINENADDDDNPGISDLIGRAEVAGYWNVNKDNTLGVTLRHSLKADTNGSVRLEWLRNIADGGIPGSKSGLRFHTQLFTGYGDSLVDYNRRRTVLSIGLSLVDW
ncbi:MAG: phospholipase A [Rhodoferax sp.]|uniref:phospholipase A n=1 Tax=Rhodoferax sp. TaxID=50421 RepID=UPI002719586D|nr:phospholipase A [Rhodoferax sp.]MDO8449001.1 phospholipase A [Rhodoferax sp.]